MISNIDPSCFGESITWTRAKLRKFKRAHAKAVRNSIQPIGTDVFRFEGHDFLIGYAAYMIEHLDSRLSQ